MSEKDKELTDAQIEVNRKKSEAMKARWAKKKEGDLKNAGDRTSKRYDYDCFNKLGLSNLQKQFVVTFMDPPFNGDNDKRHEVYNKIFTASTINSLKANTSALMNKSKIKEAILKYQVYALKNLKIESTSRNINALKIRANYLVTDFYEADGTPKPLDKIDPNLLVVIDDIDIDYKLTNTKEKKITKYKLADRDKAMKSLQEMLGIMKQMESLEVSIPTSAGKNAIESVEGKKDSGPRQPRVTFTIGVDE